MEKSEVNKDTVYDAAIDVENGVVGKVDEGLEQQSLS